MFARNLLKDQSMSVRLQREYERLVAARDQARARRQAIADRAQREGRGADDLTKDEQRAFIKLTRELEGGDGDEGLEERVGHVAAELARSRGDDETKAVLAATANAAGGPTPPGSGVPAVMWDQDELRRAHVALASRGSYRIEQEQRAFSPVSSLLPPWLSPSIIGPAHESRLLTRLPVSPANAPVIEYVRHTTTSGAPFGPTSEGQPKPELVLGTEKILLSISKLACHSGISWESIRDFDAWYQYVTLEIGRQLVDSENNELLNGDGTTVDNGDGTTTVHMTGLLHTSGILTHAVGQSETPLDAVESSIAALRSGPALAEANLAIFNPATWSAVRRQKDSQNRYLVTPNPLADTANSIWGVPTLITTALAPGAAVLLDTTRLGRTYVLDNLVLTTGYSGDDLVRNIVRAVLEERIGLAVERPGAVLSITGLPTS